MVQQFNTYVVSATSRVPIARVSWTATASATYKTGDVKDNYVAIAKALLDNRNYVINNIATDVLPEDAVLLPWLAAR
jgi:hypothetical protein